MLFISIFISQGDPGLPGLHGITVSHASCVDVSMFCQDVNDIFSFFMVEFKDLCRLIQKKIRSIVIEQIILATFYFQIESPK